MEDKPRYNKTCAICSREDKLSIEREIMKGKSHSSIARQFNVSRWSVDNHAANHLSRGLMTSHKFQTALDSASLIKDFEFLVSKSKDVLAQAEAKGWLNTSLAALRELRASWESWTKIGVAITNLQREQEMKEEEQERQELQDLSREELEILQASLTGAASNKFTAEELKLLRAILSKRPGEQLLAIKIEKRDRTETDREETEPPLELKSRKRRPPLTDNPF